MPIPIDTIANQPWITSRLAASPIAVVLKAIAGATLWFPITASIIDRAFSLSLIIFTLKDNCHCRQYHYGEPYRTKDG